jgi:hypothetical protein
MTVDLSLRDQTDQTSWITRPGVPRTGRVDEALATRVFSTAESRVIRFGGVHRCVIERVRRPS